MTSARCLGCPGDTSADDRFNADLRRHTHRKYPAGLRALVIRHEPGCIYGTRRLPSRDKIRSAA